MVARILLSSLEKRGNAVDMPILRELSAHCDPEIREIAFKAYLRQNPPDLISELRAKIIDPSERVRRMAFYRVTAESDRGNIRARELLGEIRESRPENDIAVLRDYLGKSTPHQARPKCVSSALVRFSQ